MAESLPQTASGTTPLSLQDPWDHTRLCRLLADEQLPLMLVDLDVFEANCDRLCALARAGGKRLRVASKSVRVPELLRRIQQRAGEVWGGLMCFAAAEAELLFAEGFDDLLIAYPSFQPDDIRRLFALREQGAQVVAMADGPAHLELYERGWRALSAGRQAAKLPICVDVDVSYRPLGRRGPHLGVQRSSIRDLASLRAICEQLQASEQLVLAGVMGYEAQVAGLADRNPFSPLLNLGVRWMQRRSVRDVARRRREIAALLTELGVDGVLFNGGGTGSLQSSAAEPWLTEVTAGSGFLQSQLFDYYGNNRNQPAFCFALPVTRRPQPRIVTCQSGGFIASGSCGPDKAPVPFRPAGLRLLADEGCGEVQTPLRLPPGLELRLGDPVFFRPAKAGEIAEHFDSYLLKRADELCGRVPTYRGMGRRFY